jgi:hypothetical protein
MAVKGPNGHKIYQQHPLQDPQKFTQIGTSWFENVRSGNPGVDVMITIFGDF